jgi:hypothetical protein
MSKIFGVSFWAISLVSVSAYFYELLINGSVEISGQAILAKAVVIFTIMAIVSTISLRSGVYIEKLIASRYELSYIRMNRGDECAIEAYGNRSRLFYLKSIFAFIVAIIANLLSSWIGGFVGL